MAPLSAVFLVFLGASVTCGAAAPDSSTLPKEVAAARDPSFQPGNLLHLIAARLGDDQQQLLRSSIESQVGELERDLEPILKALPRNKQHKWQASAVRYALHRLFMQKRSWRVVGLDPFGASWNSSSPSQVFAGLPNAVQDLVEKRISNDGLDAQEAAVVAGTVEFFLHAMATLRLKYAYAYLGLSQDGDVNLASAMQAIDVFMIAFIMGYPAEVLKPEVFGQDMGNIHTIYPAWDRTQNFVHGIVKAKLTSNVVPYYEVISVVRQVEDEFGRWWSGSECTPLKKHLVGIETQGTGRVPLADFYGKSLNGDWQFSESFPYLQQLGAVEGASQSSARVIIPNYMTSVSNCIGDSETHLVCCQNECDGLFSGLEQSLGVPQASPDQIAATIAALPSATMPAGRTISTLQQQRLRRIASDHGGSVPIHGRLFAQWMHHAYPRECPYPHLSGTTNPTTPDAWMQAGGVVVAGEVEMRSHVDASKDRRKTGPVESAPWSHEEELLVDSSVVANSRPIAWEAFHGLVGMAALATLAIGLANTARKIVKRPRGKRAKLADTHFPDNVLRLV